MKFVGLDVQIFLPQGIGTRRGAEQLKRPNALD